MPRRPNSRHTLIYWLIDVRPETIGAGWHSGKPFYCGKTVEKPNVRLSGHRAKAKRWLQSPTHCRVIECGEYIRIDLMETVPPRGDWVAREKHWIEIIRFSFPGVTNLADGGQGVAGLVMSDEHKRKIGAANRGRKPSPNAIAGSRAARMGKSLSADQLAKISASLKGKPKSESHRLSAKEALAKVDRRPALKAAWVLRKGRDSIMKAHGPDIFRKCGIEHLAFPKRRSVSK